MSADDVGVGIGVGVGVGVGVGAGAGVLVGGADAPGEFVPLPPPPHAVSSSAAVAAVELLMMASRFLRQPMDIPTLEPPFASVPIGSSSRRHRPP